MVVGASSHQLTYSTLGVGLQVSPRGPFALVANALNEIGLTLRPSEAGARKFYVNVVDTENNTLLRTFLVAATVEAPAVTKVFELTVPLNQSVTKRVSYRNPYPAARTFVLLCSRRDLVQPKEEELVVPGHESRYISLCFAPCVVPGFHEVLVVINDTAGKTEECFAIKVTVAKAAAAAGGESLA